VLELGLRCGTVLMKGLNPRKDSCYHNVRGSWMFVGLFQSLKKDLGSLQSSRKYLVLLRSWREKKMGVGSGRWDVSRWRGYESAKPN
jgi:hypothetical protein